MHISYKTAVAALADADWGRRYESLKEAEEHLLNDKPALTAFALLELLNRLNKVGKALRGSRDRQRPRRPTVNEDTGVFPETKIGDRLYLYDIEAGLQEFMVVAKDAAEHCFVVELRDFNLDREPVACLAGNHLCKTAAEAMEKDAKWTLQTYEQLLVRSKQILQAVEKKCSLTEFEKGLEEEDSDE